jgi:hypothetical protein
VAADWNGPGRLVLLLTPAPDASASLAPDASPSAPAAGASEPRPPGSHAPAEQQRLEAALEQARGERATLLREVHHRVKNNLQMVASLLALQMDAVPEGDARDLLQDSARRVRSIALVQDHLYGSASLERVDLAGYARSLAEITAHTLAPKTRLVVEADPVEVSLEHAVPVGLILNELLTNAFTHGARGEGGEVHVTVLESGAHVRVRVRDTGPGLPEGFDLRQGTRLGLPLVTKLVRQLRGRLSARSEGGAVFELDFVR